MSRKEGLLPYYERTGERQQTVDGDVDIWRSNDKSYDYRLPTEAEWEYACRAGTETDWSFANDRSLRSSYGVFGELTTKPCGSRLPNPWGLFDMHGNVCEWCEDWYKEQYDPQPIVVDSHGPTIGERPVHRGGGFQDGHWRTGSLTRSSFRPTARGLGFGFRVARSCPENAGNE